MPGVSFGRCCTATAEDQFYLRSVSLWLSHARGLACAGVRDFCHRSCSLPALSLCAVFFWAGLASVSPAEEEENPTGD